MKKVLVIEDDSYVRFGIKELLSGEGFKVYTAEDGREGAGMAGEILPDIIICDIMMPGLDGYKVLESLREDDLTSSIPFIFLTAKAEMRDLRKGMELGADDYIIKPFESDTLLSAVNTRLQKKERLLKDISNTKRTVNQSEDKKLGEKDSIFVECGKTSEFIKISGIKALTAMGNYSSIYIENKKSEIVRKSLNNWQEILPESIFVRIHRSTIINLNFVTKISKWSSGTYKIHIKDEDQSFTLSQRYANQIKKKLKI